MSVSSLALVRVFSAFRMTARALDDTYGWLVLWVPVIPIMIATFALFFAGVDQSATTFSIRFLAGVVTAINGLIIVFGGFFSTLLFAGAMWKMSHQPGHISKAQGPDQRHGTITMPYWLGGLIITLVWLAPSSLAMRALAASLLGE